MNAEHYQFITFDLDRGVLTLRLNRPEAMNAINAGLHEELSRVFAEIAGNRAVHAVVLTGEGRGFCAGGDLAWFRDIDQRGLDQLFREARKIIIDMLELPQPIIAAVNGHAAGLGATLALFCDMIYVAESAKLADPHVRIGVAAGDGGSAIWPLLVGPARAKQYLFTGDSLSASEAERIGLVNQVVADSETLTVATAMARRLADGPRLAIQASKASVNQILRDTVNLVLDTSLALEKENFFSADHKEAIKAFEEKRPPVYRGV
ncbi:enoyl-CoA hydratase/isomerase family protein [Pseudomonas sp. JQ170]|uniref:enoyl-CoA hydratase/isomerase family protein n=1 Tax=unclassified Pseudomonas TaxID=196821 RepID=UPI00264D81A2|nr:MULTISPECIES: enoyl-CoA hydratase-related protein [unclassified Pseudomonas]MDN7139860.1 enoyl-CoA hydratase/isomerase family protein [Pseudomonas sp. JQ170]WRO73686.1 enoyl-CoA hydratase-related protein [Pseudomonas sp. 170C]